MTTYGTSHFVSIEHAQRYYRDYGFGAGDVQRKITEGEIHIGLPPRKPGERLTRIDDGCRYAIEEAPAADLYDEMVAAGIPTDNHESDLYVPDSQTALDIIARHGVTFSRFTANSDGKVWLDIPFMYAPWWRART